MKNLFVTLLILCSFGASAKSIDFSDLENEGVRPTISSYIAGMVNNGTCGAMAKAEGNDYLESKFDTLADFWYNQFKDVATKSEQSLAFKYLRRMENESLSSDAEYSATISYCNNIVKVMGW